MINYNIDVPGKPKPQFKADTSTGIREMIYWNLNQLQFKNPQTQIITLKNMTPSPFITLIFGDGQKMLVDVDGKEKDDILSHLRRIVGKSDEELLEEVEIKDPSTFGEGADRWCICEVPGQVACPGYVPLPKEMTGKYQAAVARGEEA